MTPPMICCTASQTSSGAPVVTGPAYAVAVRAATELLTSGTYDSVPGGIAYDTMNDAVTAAP
jgi:hypothetical protein